MALVNAANNKIIAERPQVAATFLRRLKGLLGTSELPCGEALIIMPCNSVHTFGMNYRIDVLFMDKKNTVLKTVHAMKPGQLSVCFSSSYVVELPAGTLEETETSIGDTIEYR